MKSYKNIRLNVKQAPCLCIYIQYQSCYLVNCYKEACLWPLFVKNLAIQLIFENGIMSNLECSFMCFSTVNIVVALSLFVYSFQSLRRSNKHQLDVFCTIFRSKRKNQLNKFLPISKMTYLGSCIFTYRNYNWQYVLTWAIEKLSVLYATLCLEIVHLIIQYNIKKTLKHIKTLKSHCGQIFASDSSSKLFDTMCNVLNWKIWLSTFMLSNLIILNTISSSTSQLFSFCNHCITVTLNFILTD